MHIQFLGMEDGCPNTPKMRVSLDEALRELQWDVEVDSLDVNVLSEEADVRAGYGSPTILVNGEDLFGAPIPDTHDAACRLYRGGLPGTAEIMKKLKKIRK